MFLSVKARFTLLHLFMILTVALVLGLMSYQLIVNALEKLQKGNLVYVATTKADHLKTLITNQEDLLQQVALGDIVKRYSQTYQDKLLQEYFSKFSAEFNALSFVNRDGVEELRVEQGQYAPDLHDYSKSRLFEEISWETNQVFTTLSLDEDGKADSQLISGYYRQNYFGLFEGIIIAKSRLSHLMQPFRQFRLGETGFLMVMDDAGTVLTHPQQQALQNPVTFEGEDSEQLVLQALDMQTGVGRARILDIDGFYAYAPVQDRGWTLIAVLPYSEFNTEPKRYKNLFLQSLLFIVLGGILLSAYMSTTISRPIRQLTSSSNRIAQGDLSQRVIVDSADEIGQLGESFNTMANNLQQSKAEQVADAKIRESLLHELELKYAELERFSYTVSHDLKSPLVTVKGFVGLLRQDVKDDNQERVEQDLEQISDATDKMATLLEDLLELSRAGRLINETVPVPLSDLFHDAEKLLASRIEACSAQLIIQADMPVIQGDRQRLLEVAQNLLENAIKFHRPQQVPSVSVNARSEGSHIICCVKDNGIGIEPKYHQRIFGLFNRLDETYEGTGIGLALVKRIIEVHNGSISISSNGDGAGAEFCFSLPALHQEK